MILVYVDNKHFGEVSSLSFSGRVAYRNPRYFKEVEKCDGVYIHGKYPEIEKAYKGKLIELETGSLAEQKGYSISDLREKKKELSESEFNELIKGDTRKSVNSL